MNDMRVKTCGEVSVTGIRSVPRADSLPDMVETEERKMKEREEAAHEQEQAEEKAGKPKHKAKHHHNAGEHNGNEHAKSK